jgi:hypothetical protein
VEEEKKYCSDEVFIPLTENLGLDEGGEEDGRIQSARYFLLMGCKGDGAR